MVLAHKAGVTAQLHSCCKEQTHACRDHDVLACLPIAYQNEFQCLLDFFRHKQEQGRPHSVFSEASSVHPSMAVFALPCAAAGGCKEEIGSLKHDQADQEPAPEPPAPRG